MTTLPAWQNARTHAATLARAAERGRQVLRLLIDSALKNGEAIPEVQWCYSGTCLAAAGIAAWSADAGGGARRVSLNQWIVCKLSA